MRLRSFTAPTIAQAMQLVREALGPEAIIVSTHAAGKSAPARVTVAVEEQRDALETAERRRDDGAAEPGGAEARAHGAIRDAFAFHGVPAVLAQRLGGLAGDALRLPGAVGDPLLALAAALDGRFRFRAIGEVPARPIMLVGPSGAGKTATTAKLAARAALAGRRLGVITTDTLRAGGVEQLGAFVHLLALDLQIAEDAGALADGVLAASGLDGVLIDTAGANPYDDGELARLKALIDAADAEAVLVLPAGGDPLEAAETAAAFAEIGARRLIATRLDAARRLGGLLSAAEAGKLAFAEIGTTPHIAEGLAPLNPVALARLLLGELSEAGRHPEPLKALA